jgi:hypothetical protein
VRDDARRRARAYRRTCKRFKIRRLFCSEGPNPLFSPRVARWRRSVQRSSTAAMRATATPSHTNVPLREPETALRIENMATVLNRSSDTAMLLHASCRLSRQAARPPKLRSVLSIAISGKRPLSNALRRAMLIATLVGSMLDAASNRLGESSCVDRLVRNFRGRGRSPSTGPELARAYGHSRVQRLLCWIR